MHIRPNYPQASHNLGNILRELGRVEEALAYLERSISLGGSESDQAALFEAHRRFDATWANDSRVKMRAHVNPPDRDRPLRIGYLSSDLQSHPVARHLLPVVRNHNRNEFHIYCYADVIKPDSTTAAFRAAAKEWRSIVGLSDEQVSELIRRDGIDILVCLAGRFDRNRPLVCLFESAPIQISYHDVATSGLSAMNYLISDRVLTPRNTAENFTERLLCLPGFYVAEIPDELPQVESRDELIVFGCLNAPAKINDAVLDLWAKLLCRIPESRLILRYKNLYQSPSLRRRVYSTFAKYGIDSRRIVLPEAATSPFDHLALYNQIDIALDPFPFSGSTTTFEALLMGVPVVTWAGRTMVSRWSASTLRTLSLTELVAASAEDYLTIAADLAGDAGRRADLRNTLRDRVTKSALTDGGKKARQLERFYRAVWRIWCAARA